MLEILMVLSLIEKANASVVGPRGEDAHRVRHVVQLRSEEPEEQARDLDAAVEPPESLKISTRESHENSSKDGGTRDPADIHKIKGRRKSGGAATNKFRSEGSMSPGATWRQISDQYLQPTTPDAEQNKTWWESFREALFGR